MVDVTLDAQTLISSLLGINLEVLVKRPRFVPSRACQHNKRSVRERLGALAVSFFLGRKELSKCVKKVDQSDQNGRLL